MTDRCLVLHCSTKSTSIRILDDDVVGREYAIHLCEEHTQEFDSYHGLDLQFPKKKGE